MYNEPVSVWSVLRRDVTSIDRGPGGHGVIELIVDRRRHTFLWDESSWSVVNKLLGLNVVSYHFGSMTEGTTTPGMGSDIDTLQCDHSVNIMSGWPEWEHGRHNLLMVKHETRPASTPHTAI